MYVNFETFILVWSSNTSNMWCANKSTTFLAMISGNLNDLEVGYINENPITKVKTCETYIY